MFAIAKYKTVKVFTWKNGVEYGLGSEIVLEDAEGEWLVKQGSLQMEKYLNINDPSDKEDINKFSPSETNVSDDTIDTQDTSNKSRVSKKDK